VERSARGHGPSWHRAVPVAAVLAALTGWWGRSSSAQPGDEATTPVVPPWWTELVPRPRPLVARGGGVPVLVEVANTRRERGLGYRDGDFPATGTGVLFVADWTVGEREPNTLGDGADALLPRHRRER